MPPTELTEEDLPAASPVPSDRVRLGPFEFDLETGQLWRGGRPVPLAGQPSAVLRALVEQPGHVISRHELQDRLWPDRVVADPEKGLNTAVKSLRQALGDPSEAPRLVGTVRGRGYRLLVPATPIGELPPGAHTAASRRRRKQTLLLALTALVVAVWSVTRQTSAPPLSPPPTNPWHRIAVLPLKPLGSDPGTAELAAVLTEEVTTRVASVAPLRLAVLGRRTASRLAERPLEETFRPPYRVDYVVEGSVSGGAAPVAHLRLIATGDLATRWSARFDLDPRDLDPTSERVEREVVEALGLPVRAGSPVGSSDSGATRGYLEALALLRHPDRERLLAAREQLEGTVTLDPGFGRAWALLARVELLRWQSGLASGDEAVEAVEKAARQALSAAPELALAHAYLAEVLWRGHWDWQRAETSFRRAVALAPHDPEVRHRLAWYLLASRRHPEARAEMARALALDPLSPELHSDLGWFHYRAGDFEGALVHCGAGLAIDRELPSALECRHRALARLGRYREARDALSALLSPERVSSLHQRIEALPPEEAYRQLLGRAAARERDLVPPFFAATSSAAAGEPEWALALLERASTHRDPWLVLIAVSPELDPLAENPRFRALLRAIAPPDS